jgi:hypothetical protein
MFRRITPFRRDIPNFVTQLFVKGFAVPFNIIMIGWAARTLPAREQYLLLSTPNLLLLLGLLQFGLGYFITRRAAHLWAHHDRLEDAADIRGAFWMIFAISILACATVLALGWSGLLPAAIVPVLVLGTISLWTAVADYIRLAIGEVFKTNILLMSGFAVCALLMQPVASRAGVNEAIIYVLVMGPVYFSNAASFALLYQRPFFRRIISPRSKIEIIKPLRDTIPMLLYTLGFLGLMNLPLAQHVNPYFPRLSLPSLACLRLSISVISTYNFILQPLTPIILRMRYHRSEASFLALAGTVIALIVVADLFCGIAFAWFGPTVMKFWLRIELPGITACLWGTILALWMAVVTMAVFCQITSRVYLAAISLIAGLLVALLLPLGMPHITVENAMIGGLIASFACGAVSTVLALKDAKPDLEAVTDEELSARRA